jgi:addiction module HigA family antidote
MAGTHTFNPDYAVPPGATLCELIKEHAISQRELAERTGLTRKTINEIIKGKAPLTSETAQKLELVLQAPAQFWNERERLYRQRIALKEHEEKLQADLGWEKNFPYAELARRKLVPATANARRRIWNLCRFFGVSQPQFLDNNFADFAIFDTLFRRRASTKPKPYLAWTWLRAAEIEAQSMEVMAFSSDRFQECVSDVPKRTAAIRDQQSLNTFITETRESFRLSGVALVLVPEFARAAINGAAFWRGDRPIIALTLRGKRLDSLVFTLLHEAAHILHHGKKIAVVDADDSGRDGSDRSELEGEADRLAARWCIPQSFDASIAAVRTPDDVDQISREVGVHRDLVIGRYAKLTGNYSRFSARKMKLSWNIP